MTASHFASHAVLASILCVLASCKPAAAPKAAQDQTPGEPSPQTHSDVRRQPSTAELNTFIWGILPPVIKLVDVKNDPPVPMPNTSPGSNVWLFNVRLTLAATEDELAEAPPLHVQAFQAAEDELSALAAWSVAYAGSPYASLYPSFMVNPPLPASPKLLTVVHPKDQPRAAVYGKLAAEWQVDHWQFSIMDMPLPADDGKFRSGFTGPVLVEGEPATARFLAVTKSAIAEAKPKKAAIEAAYEDDLLKATRPGTFYRGQVSVGSTVVAAEVHFLETPTADRQVARFEVRMPSAPGYAFIYTAKLANQVPIHPIPVAGDNGAAVPPNDAEPVPKADLTVGLEHAGGKEVVAPTVPNELLMALTHYSPPRALPLSLRNGRLEGKIAVSSGDYGLSAQRVP